MKSAENADVKLSKERKSTLQTKVVIRRLPPTWTKDDFLSQLSPLPEHDYLSFIKADLSLGRDAFTRAYINFVTVDDIYSFREKLDGYVFVDSKGGEYPAMVEFAPFQKIPKKKFKKLDAKKGTIEQDVDYVKFLEQLQNPVVEETPTMEATIEELEARERNSKGQTKVKTPLIEYIKRKREERRATMQRMRDDRRRKEIERLKLKEDKRRGDARQQTQKSSSEKDKSGEKDGGAGDKPKSRDKEKLRFSKEIREKNSKEKSSAEKSSATSAAGYDSGVKDSKDGGISTKNETDAAASPDKSSRTNEIVKDPSESGRVSRNSKHDDKPPGSWRRYEGNRYGKSGDGGGGSKDASTASRKDKIVLSEVSSSGDGSESTLSVKNSKLTIKEKPQRKTLDSVKSLIDETPSTSRESSLSKDSIDKPPADSLPTVCSSQDSTGSQKRDANKDSEDSSVDPRDAPEDTNKGDGVSEQTEGTRRRRRERPEKALYVPRRAREAATKNQTTD